MQPRITCELANQTLSLQQVNCQPCTRLSFRVKGCEFGVSGLGIQQEDWRALLNKYRVQMIGIPAMTKDALKNNTAEGGQYQGGNLAEALKSPASV